MTNTHTTLSSLFTAIANSIRNKNGSTQAIIADTFPTEIRNLRTGFDYNNHNTTAISDYEFYNCTDLKNVDCSNLTSIGASAFEGCSGLKSVILYDDVIEVGENAFKGCNNVTIYCEVDSKPDTWHENWNPDDCEVVWGYWIPIETLDMSATKNDNVIATVFKKNDIYKIDITGSGQIKNYVNYSPWDSSYTKSIEFITIHDGITRIGDYTFKGCSSLTSITIPDSITIIGEYAFMHCSSLTSITIPNSVTRIGDDAFGNCFGLTSVNISDLASWCNIFFVSYTSNPLYYAHNLYLNGELITNLVIPDSVTRIGDYAFEKCFDLTSITIPDGVTRIGDHAFESCTSLTFVNIPNSVIYIGDSAFSYTPLTSITIPNSVTSIGNHAFTNCVYLTFIIIPDSVISIGNHAFYNCKGLTSIIIPDSVTSIDGGTFYGCEGLTSVTVPDSVTYIGSNAFKYCISLTSITYTGTIAQWKAITFGKYWASDTGNYTIHCTDGDIAKDGTITYHTTE